MKKGNDALAVFQGQTPMLKNSNEQQKRQITAHSRLNFCILICANSDFPHRLLYSSLAKALTTANKVGANAAV